MFRWLILLAAFVVLSACMPAGAATEVAVPATEAPAAVVPATEEPFSMALVMIGPREDGSWAEAAFNALEIQKAKGVRTAYSEVVPDTDVARVLREYADAGYDVVVAHSFSYGDMVFQVAGEYPDTNFAWAGAMNRTGENVADYDQPFYEAGYLVGILAGHMSQSGKIGYLAGFDIPGCRAMANAIEDGARTVNPNITLIYSAVGDWGDVGLAKEAALAQADAQVDFWAGCGEGPTIGSIEAAKEVGGYATGYVGDMADLAPETVVGSIVWNMEPILDALVVDTQNKTMAKKFYQFGVREGVLDLVLNPAMMDKIPAEALTAIDKAREEIKAGTLEIPYQPEAR